MGLSASYDNGVVISLDRGGAYDYSTTQRHDYPITQNVPLFYYRAHYNHIY